MAKKKREPETETPASDHRRRLKHLAFSTTLSRTPSTPATSLPPSKTLLKHRGRDVVKKGQRKNRFLFSFPGFLSPVASGGRVGELAELASGNPVLYLDFPQGQMKLFGTIVYPKNRYLTLQFAKKNVACEDSFDSLVVFSDAWWIGKKDENPEEHKLKIPSEFSEETREGYDFNGGAGDTNGEKLTVSRTPAKEQAKQSRLDIPSTDDSSEDSDVPIGNILQSTPVRQSARMAGKTKRYAEHSSGEESISSDPDTSDKKTIANVVSAENKTSTEIGHSDPQPQDPHVSEGQSRKNQSTQGKKASLEVQKSEGKSAAKQGTLVQATLSTLFEKAADKKLKTAAGGKDSPKSKGSGSNTRYTSARRTRNTMKKSDEENIRSDDEMDGTGKQQTEHQDDSIEEISSDSKILDESDEDWSA